MTSVLIVDDEHLLVGCLAEYLEARGYDVTTATSYSEALQVCEAVAPDAPEVLITDLSLPDGRVADLISRVSERQSAPHVIVISGRDELPSDVSQYEVDAIVLKPFDPETLVGAIQQALDKQG